MPRLQWSSMVQLARKATAGGATRRSATVLEWDVAGNCEQPVLQECWSRPASDDPKKAEREFAKAMAAFIVKAAKRVARGGPWQYSWEKLPKRVASNSTKYITVGKSHGPGVLVVDMWVRCRKCPTCRKQRSRMWYARAITETAAAQRTWFGTITLHPDANHASLARARYESTRRGHIWEEMTPHEQFAQLHRMNGVHLQLWLKRVRKQSGATIRFLLVCEAHKSGLPHYHCLVHEQVGSAPLRHKVLSDQWKLGFTNFKLVTDVRSAGYVCKYLSKSALARVRASARYGQTFSQHSFEKQNVDKGVMASRGQQTMTPCADGFGQGANDSSGSATGDFSGDDAYGLPSCTIEQSRFLRRR